MAKTKVINGETCVEIKGFYLPEPKNPAMTAMLTAVKLGHSKPSTYIEKLGYDPNNYKVRLSEHTPTENPTRIKRQNPEETSAYDILLDNAKNSIIIFGMEQNKGQVMLPYTTCAALAPDADFSNISFIKHLRARISSDKRTLSCVFNDEGFSIRYKGLYDPTDPRNDEFIIKENIVKEAAPENNNREFSNVADNAIDDIILDQLNKRDITVVDEADQSDAENNGMLVISSDDLNVIAFNGVECAVVNRYAIPLYIVEKCENAIGDYEFPTSKSKIKALFKQHNLQPKKFKLLENNIDDEDIVDSVADDDTINEAAEKIANIVEETLTKISKDEDNYPEEYSEQQDYDSLNSEQCFDEDEDDTESIIDDESSDEPINQFERFYGFVANIFIPNLENYAANHPEYVDAKAYVNIPVEKIVEDLFIPLADESHVEIPNSRKYFEAIKNNGKFNFAEMTIGQISEFYDLIGKFTRNISIDYNSRTLGIYIPALAKNEELSMEEYWNMHMKKSAGMRASEWVMPLHTVDSAKFLNAHFIDAEENEINALSEFFSASNDFLEEFYSAHDDNQVCVMLGSNKHDYDTFSAYADLKDRMMSCESYEDFMEFITPNNLHMIINIMKIFVNNEEFRDEEIDNFGVIDTINNATFIDILDALTDPQKGDTEVDTTETEVNDQNINLYTINNNINNNDESNDAVEDTSSKDDSNSSNEEDFGMYGEQILDAITKLTEVTRQNNNLISKQNDLLTLFGAKLDKIDNEMVQTKQPESEHDDEPAEPQLLPYNVQYPSNESDGPMVIIDINDLRGKNIIVTHGNKAVVTNLDSLVDEAIRNTPNAHMISIKNCNSAEL